MGPVYATAADPASLLASAYRNSLQLALDHQCRSVAFPAISCGVFGYPLAEAAEIALGTCADKRFQALDIHFFLFGEQIFDIWTGTLQNR